MPAIAVFTADTGVTLRNFATGETLTAEGKLGLELRELLASGKSGPLLAALPPSSVAATAMQLANQVRMPLHASAALRLQGFETLFLEVVGTCNERCLHCYAESSPDVSARLTHEQCEAVLHDAAKLGFQRVQFTGGEPLLCEFLVDLLALAGELGIAGREIYTNGTLLTEQRLASLKPHEPEFAFSFYSHDPQVHDAITCMQGSHQKTVAAIVRVVDAGLNARVAMIVMEQNAADVDATLDYLRHLGVDQIGVSASHAVGRGSRHHDPAGADTATHRPSGGTVGGVLCVSYTGDVYPCIFNRRDKLGCIAQRRLTDIVARPETTSAPATRSSLAISDTDRLQCASCQLTARALAACATPRSA